jgi:hypothetical protein
MTQYETDDSRTTAEKFHEWKERPASVTNGHLLLSRLVWTFFLAISAFVGYRQLRLDNELTRDRIDHAISQAAAACQLTNERRDEAKLVAEGDIRQDQASLDSDLASWQAIDELFEGGIPEPARTTVFAGLTVRQGAIDTQSALVELTYQPATCPSTTQEIVDGTLPADE